MIEPLQTELLVFGALYLSVAAFVGYWTHRDARKRGSDKAINWGLAMSAFALMSPLPLLVGIALYLSVRGEFGDPGADETEG